MPNSCPKIVLFDLGGVLVDVQLERVFHAWESHTKTPARVLETHFLQSGIKSELDQGNLTLAQCMETMELTPPIPRETFCHIWSQALRANPSMDRLATQLAHKVSTGLLSNIDPIHHRWAQQNLQCLSAFQWEFVSYKERARKPSLQIYQQVLSHIGSAASNICFIDDREENIERAKQVGFDGIVFRGYEELTEALTDRGLWNKDTVL